MARQIPETPPERARARVFRRADDYWWQSRDTGAEYGPFRTRLEATQDSEIGEREGDAESESLSEAESEIGIADWIDPDTGAPAEEDRPRLEDH